MAILVNMSQRGFILKEGLLAPGKELVVDAEVAQKLASIYKKELKVILTEAKVEAPKEAQSKGSKLEPKEEKPVEKQGNSKKGQAK